MSTGVFFSAEPLIWRGLNEIKFGLLLLLFSTGTRLGGPKGETTFVAFLEKSLKTLPLLFKLSLILLLDDCGDSALHWAAYKNNQQTFALLHYMGLPADKADEYGSTALHLAAAQGASAVVEYMIENVTEAEFKEKEADKKEEGGSGKA